MDFYKPAVVLQIHMVMVAILLGCGTFWSTADAVTGPGSLKSKFSSVNRRDLLSCTNDPNSYLAVSLDTAGPLSNVQNVTVTVSGVRIPSETDWIGVFADTSNNFSFCPSVKRLYVETGDLSSLPLSCSYPVKAKFLAEDPSYLECNISQCQKKVGNLCIERTCNASITFRLVNIRTNITFVLFTGGFDAPCILKTLDPIQFNSPAAPLYGHLSCNDSTGTTMKLTWVSGDSRPQSVAYLGGPQVTLTLKNSAVITFNKSDLCVNNSGPAASFGWHDPGFIHSALLTGLLPSSTYTYRYGSDLVGWSIYTNFTTPPAPARSATVRFIAYGDMGKAERDGSIEHYIQPGSLQVIDAVTAEVLAGNVDAVFHIGDISYATGFIAEWDFFLEMIHPVASKVPYLTAIGNHERDFPDSGSFYTTRDSGGECGVPYETHFQMPIQGKDMPWYSIELGPVHFTIMSTEHNWTLGSDQYNWIANDLASVNRTRTPWLVFTGHRPQYSTVAGGLLADLLPPSVDPVFAPAVEPLFVMYKVDLVLWGHVHNYERTCAVFQGICSLLPTKDINGTDTYMGTPYRAPVHAVIGMSGFSLDPFEDNPANWSLARASAFGYVRVEAVANQLLFQYIFSSNGTVGDSFKIVK